MRGFCCTCLEIICCFFLPPLVVAYERGCGWEFILNCLLFLCGLVPGRINALTFVGMLHGLYVVLCEPEETQYVIHQQIYMPAPANDHAINIPNTPPPDYSEKIV